MPFKQSDPEYRQKHRLDPAPEPGLSRESLLALGQLEEKRRALQVAADLGVDVSTAAATLDDEEHALRESAEPSGTPPPDPEKDDPERRERRHRGELTEAEVRQTRDWVAVFVETGDRRALSQSSRARSPTD